MSKRKTTEQFIADAVAVHGDKYDYSKVDYKYARELVTVICPEHGSWDTTPNNHLRGKGCFECSKIVISKKVEDFYRKTRDWDFEQPEEYKLIPLNTGMKVKVSNEDFDILRKYNWLLATEGYAYNKKLGFMHRYIMNCPKGLDVDHKDGDKLDNRRSELRICTRSSNLANQNSRKGSSMYKGVTKHKQGGWFSQVTFNSKPVYIGYFKDEIECAKAYDKKALELFGEFARLNFPELRGEYLKLK